MYIGYLKNIIRLTIAGIFLWIFLSVNSEAQVYADPGFMELYDTTALSGFTEGPHVQWTRENRFEAVFARYDHINDSLTASSISYKTKNKGKYIRGMDFGPKEYFIEPVHHLHPGVIESPEKIFVIGDVHGEYDRLREILENNGIISSSGNWSLGRGELVFLGDLMDRGNKVTECLWFVKKLQHQAAEKGGRVHVLLGNHEIMNLTGDHRYIHKKYRKYCEKLGVDYFKLFSRDMELGRWLRSMNTMLKINDNLFVHAGISPELLEKQLSVDSINELTHQFLRSDINDDNFDILYFLTDVNGPYWYRGFLSGFSGYSGPDEREVRKALDFYGVSRIIFGHSEHKFIQINKEKTLFGIDIPMRYTGRTEQGLLIEGDEIFKVFSDGTKVKVE